ncbi:MAG TPA: hypothetical protein VNX46_14610 [Candidatus Acidoferrum sp.]|jgi:hypothetical protein|nr:hypothetical protein [Candidatus Acidoferrum sp.]
MTIPVNEIKRAWITAGSNSLWGTKGTYSLVSSDRLPTLPPIDPTFAWLESVPDRDYGCTLGSNNNKLGSLPTVEAELDRLGFHLPEDFSVFIQNTNIYRRIPSCTACYLDLSDKVTPLPGFPGSYVVRFMNDSQCCFLWYLLFQPSQPVRVLATACFIERDIFDAMDYLADESQPLDYRDVLKESLICAESFGEFICRFGIENMIWFATHNDNSLSSIEQRYLEQAHR